MILPEFLSMFADRREGHTVYTTACRDILGDLFRGSGYTKGAEIGVWQGEYAQRLCERMPDLHLLCVDPWKQYKFYNEKKNDQSRLDEAYQTTVERLQPYDCQIIRKASVDAATSVPDGSLDFVYIDGNHMEPFVSQDINAWVPKVRSGGIVAGHDYLDKAKKPWIQVKRAVDAYVQQHHIGPLYIVGGDKSPSFFWVVA